MPEVIRIDHGDHDEVWTAGAVPGTFTGHHIEWHDGTGGANAETLRARAAAELDGNREFLALDPPTQVQALAQVQSLTRQANALIRMALGLLDSTD